MGKYILLLSAIISSQCLSQEVMVGLEPMPPLINPDATGYTVTLLKKIEEVSDLKFNIKIKPYVRIRKELKHGSLDLIGHTPYQNETPDFYQYAQDLSWNVISIADIYATSEDKLNLMSARKIGTPRGNAEFHSAALGIPIAKFTASGDIDSLLKMLEAGRIDIFLFERAATMKEIKNLNIRGFFYKKVMVMPSTLSLRKGPEGDALKLKIERSINKINQEDVFEEYNRYIEMPEKGVVDIDNVR
ncbi:transporter substrate-binding domain-containing protein [Aeromonas sp. R9-2]|uniref:transporter substrate-binding domain-containing protein n=1 Tax=Aeromonas sp. R9-2 TaxID=3138479 RepID=UPI0034A22935